MAGKPYQEGRLVRQPVLLNGGRVRRKLFQCFVEAPDGAWSKIQKAICHDGRVMGLPKVYYGHTVNLEFEIMPD